MGVSKNKRKELTPGVQLFPAGTIASGNLVKADANTNLVDSGVAVGGNGTSLQTSSGTLTNGDLASFDSHGNVVDSGIVAASAAITPVATSQLDPTTIQYGSVNLTSAQIKALATTPITLVAAQGAGTFIELVSPVINLTFVTAAYVNGSGGAPVYAIQVGGVNQWTDASTLKFAAALKASANAVASGGVDVGAEGASSSLLNASMTLTNTGGGSTYDLVTGSGTAVVKFAYRVHKGLS